MQYFDVTSLPEPVDAPLSRRLGFRKMFNTGSEIDVLEFDDEQKRPFLVSTKNPSLFYKLIKSGKAIGFLVDDPDSAQRFISKIKDDEKLVVFNANYIVSPETNRQSRVYKMRKIFRIAHNVRLKTAMVSLAKNQNYLLSSMQMVEIAKLITRDEKSARQMLSQIGEQIK